VVLISVRLSFLQSDEYGGMGCKGRPHPSTGNTTVVRWNSPEPQDTIFLIAAPFSHYARTAGPLQAMVFLRSSDQILADKYLDATIRYIDMYSRLIGPYPYKKFALVENFWETGFGMPSFTLSTYKVVRLPSSSTPPSPTRSCTTGGAIACIPITKKGTGPKG
jgi:hypothetical protein